jgi:hypothetical protein
MLLYHATDKTRPDTLYHYCSANAFKGMLNSKSVWLSNVFYMNDRLEHIWFRNRAREYLKTAPFPTLNDKAKTVIDEVLASTWADDIYCLCLSEQADLLSQWRGYADDGRGFSIGFNMEYFKRYRHISPAYVIYDEAEQAELMRMIFQKTRFVIDPDTGESESSTMDASDIVSGLWREAARCKNPAFAEEKEWRIIHRTDIELSPNFEVKSLMDDLNEMDFNIRSNGTIVPYIKMKLADPKNIINEVILGPKAPPGQMRAVMQLLAANGFYHTNIVIRESAASYT